LRNDVFSRLYNGEDFGARTKVWLIVNNYQLLK
ncbi:MAG: hypothetical protein ACJAUH_000241, partial [Saprospiraceae bacterium]